MNGIIIINKERGFTSFDVVAKLRGICHQKKIGHTGTLDPDATGVLPVCLGSATGVCDLLADKTKEYEATLLLGITTDTQDITGNVLTETDVNLSEADVISCIQNFTGDMEQIPPMYSAVKVGGKRLYELARRGETVERKPRPVTVYSIDVLKMYLPRVTMRVTCSKGTYIRTLCHDIGQSLGCGGTMESLVRRRVGGFDISDALTLAAVQELADAGRLNDILIPVEEVFAQYGSIRLRPDSDKLLYNGNPFRGRDILEKTEAVETGADRYRVFDSCGTFWGVYCSENERGLYRPFKMFIPDRT
ncbi:MAG: tRNA pseudouridine(55) synthase TruB [Lachnospiraceae bacterium]|nr:tRNA pseudouridine(55) synthase TruB [Lachnospiraceae bacterium]